MLDVHTKAGLEAEKVKIQSSLDAIMANYNVGFSKVENPRSMPFEFLPLGVATLKEFEPESSSKKIAEHREVASIEDSPEEAMKVWRQRFDRLPKTGDMVYWRVVPEAEYDTEFMSQKVIWKIYARLAIFDHEEVR